MTVTITVDGTAIPNDWQAQQESSPGDEVDLFVLSADLTEATPTSAPHEQGGNENAGKSSKSKK